jgi:two-component system response regulator NreC
MTPIRVLIADDHAEFRRLVQLFLNTLPHVDVVGEAVDGEEVVQRVEALRPDLVLMDIAMPKRNGLDATRIIKERWPQTRVVIATMYDNAVYRKEAQDAHADGYILKSALKPSLEAAFHTVAQY